jgi:hypothetical protein
MGISSGTFVPTPYHVLTIAHPAHCAAAPFVNLAATQEGEMPVNSTLLKKNLEDLVSLL